jgi:MFS family permease
MRETEARLRLMPTMPHRPGGPAVRSANASSPVTAARVATVADLLICHTRVGHGDGRAADAAVRAPRRERKAQPVLLVLCGAQCALFIDVSSVTVCLPSIREAFAVPQQEIQWVVTSYALTFGGFLLISGRAADAYGPRRVLVTGVIVFACGTAGVGLAPSFALLCGCRALEGMGAALLAPAVMSLTSTTFVREADRLRAFAHYGTALAGGFTFGALASGLLATVGWRAAMFINVPLCFAIAALSLTGLPRDQRSRSQRLGVIHAGIATCGALCLVYAAAQANTLGLTSWSVLMAALAAGTLLVTFVILNARSDAPLISRVLMAHGRGGAMVCAALSAATGGSAQYVATTYLQVVRGHDALATGVAVSALGIAAIAAGKVAPRIARRLGLCGLLALGLATEAFGALALAGTTVGLGLVFVGLAMATIGMGLVLATIAYTTFALHGSTADANGVMTAALRASEQLGGAVGLAVIVGIAGAHMLGSAAILAALLSAVAALLGPAVVRQAGPRCVACEE